MAKTKSERLQLAWDKMYSETTAGNRLNNIKSGIGVNGIVPESSTKSSVPFDATDIDLPGVEGGDRSAIGSGGSGASYGQVGNTVGAVSGALGNIANLAIAIGSEEPTKMNPFANYANDTLSKLSEMQSGVGAIRDMQLADLELAKNTAKESNRNSARGINELRALDTGVFVGGLGEKRKIDESYQDKILDLKGKEADVMLGRDKIVMSGQAATDEINQKNKDAYWSELSNSVMDFSAYGQNIGKQLNKTEADEIAMKLYGTGKHGTFEDYRADLGY